MLHRALHSRTIVVVALLAELVLPAWSGASPLARFHDPVVVAVARLDGITGRDSAKLRLYRVRDGRYEPIPYQFDARSADGELVVEGPADFRLDADDELVFMAKDAGERITGGMRPDGSDAAVEIEVAEPRGDGRAYAYLAAFTTPPAVSFEPYVTYDAQAREARSAFYRVDYAADRNFFTGVRIPEGAGGNTANLLRQSRMRGSPTFSLLLTDVTLDFTEQNSLVQIEGVRTGAVRSVRRVKMSVDLGPLFPELPSGISYTYHYLTSYSTPTRVKFPWLMLQTLRDFRFESVLDFQPDVMPLRYHDSDHRDGIALSPDKPFEVRTTDDHDWWVHSGRAGTMLHALVIPQQWRDWGVVRGTVVRAGAGDDRAAGEQAAAGYTLLNMTSLREAGAYDLLMASVVLPGGYAAGDEVGPMAMLNEPLVVSSHRMP
jgi:hypothetical protein